jgi:hypothetical protein
MRGAARDPGEVTASDSLLKALRLCDAVAGSGLIPRIKRRKSKPALRASAIQQIESEIGAELCDDVLTLVAIQDPIASLVTGIKSLASVAEAAADYFDAPDGWVRIGVAYHDPFGELLRGERGGPYVSLCVPKKNGGKPRLVALVDGEEEADETTFGAFVEARIREALSGERDAPAIFGKEKGLPLALDPAPRILAGRASRAPGQELVKHARFGEGEVVKRLGEGEAAKLVIRFADGERTLMARFVEPVPAEAE